VLLLHRNKLQHFHLDRLLLEPLNQDKVILGNLGNLANLALVVALQQEEE